MSRSWRHGSTPAWREVRRRVLLRDAYRCQYGLEGCTGSRQLEAHHVLGRAATGDDIRYLRTACKNCNLKLGDPTKVPDPPHVPSERW